MEEKPPFHQEYILKNLQKVVSLILDPIARMKKNTKKAVDEFYARQMEELKLQRSLPTDLEDLKTNYDKIKDHVQTSLEEMIPSPSMKISNIIKVAEQGTREYMEDTHVSFEATGGMVAAVFDGHGGDQASLFAVEFIKENFERIFLECNHNILQAMQHILDQIHTAFQQKCQNIECDAGSTAAIIYLKDGMLCSATLGDSPIHVYRKIDGEWAAIPLSPMRDWTTPKDVKRAENKYESIKAKWYLDPSTRRDPDTGRLNVSRSLGDLAQETVTTKGKISCLYRKILITQEV